MQRKNQGAISQRLVTWKRVVSFMCFLFNAVVCVVLSRDGGFIISLPPSQWAENGLYMALLSLMIPGMFQMSIPDMFSSDRWALLQMNICICIYIYIYIYIVIIIAIILIIIETSICIYIIY